MIKTNKIIVPNTIVRKPVNFGRRDKTQRAMGCLVITYECEFIEIKGAPPASWWVQPPGVYYCAHIQTTRAGSTFGRIEIPMYFLLETERDQYVKDRVQEFRLRAMK